MLYIKLFFFFLFFQHCLNMDVAVWGV